MSGSRMIGPADLVSAGLDNVVEELFAGRKLSSGYFSTIAAAIDNLPLGAIFTSDEIDGLKTYKIIEGSPGYEEYLESTISADQIEDGDNKIMMRKSNSIPSSGTWLTGTMVINSVPIVSSGKVLLGWLRLTDGSDNVPGVDWTPVYGTTS